MGRGTGRTPFMWTGNGCFGWTGRGMSMNLGDSGGIWARWVVDVLKRSGLLLAVHDCTLTQRGVSANRGGIVPRSSML